MTLSWDIPVVLTLSMHSTATLTAESNPKVKSVLDRSLSMVLGTPTTLIPIFESLSATPRVSFPPMATRQSSSNFLMVWTTFSAPPSTLNGLVLEVRMNVPPTATRSSTMSYVSLVAFGSMSPFHPRWMPMTSNPCSSARATSPRIVAFRPAQSPPPVKTPIFMITEFTAETERI